MATSFSGFSSGSFEQFIRALSVHVFGPGVTAFGRGPDGGREATFEGEVPYPYPPTQRWNGYGVIQAKFKDTSEGSKLDQAWVARELNGELTRFANLATGRRKPRYYVLVTNVALSGAKGGGRKRVADIMLDAGTKLGIVDFAIWDANQLATFLDSYTDLRVRFAPHLLSGDVLAFLLDHLRNHGLSIAQQLTRHLQRELRADATSRLDQAGDRTDEQLQLAKLFFDIRAAVEPTLERPEEANDQSGMLPPGLLKELLRAGGRVHDPAATYESENLPESSAERHPNRFLILGGPGSGKSTVTQFLCQIHRAALLSRQDPITLEQDIRTTIADIKHTCDADQLGWPTTPRHPIRIELNRFSTFLAESTAHNLADYIHRQIWGTGNALANDAITDLAKVPLLIVLDGLDEVPATSNRNAMVSNVSDFLASLRQLQADVFVVATSRQQGYAGEFAGGVTSIRHVLALSKTRAMHYVRRYATARFGEKNRDRMREVVEKLEAASQRELTAELMSTPLQVTFMATVVAARGDPGEDRWQLFNSYYRTIYDRERQKAVAPFNTVLSKHQTLIDRLHHDVGYLLQQRSEGASTSSASLSIIEFRALVSMYLEERGHQAPESETLVDRICSAADQRLIFLTSKVKGELTFDVRSLQECMAAECLMTGDPASIQDRLRRIAPLPYWRNVFRFAASKCFADAQSRHLQDSIRIICADLVAETDPPLRISRSGAELALDILLSGAVSENPNHARQLSGIALDLLSLSTLRSDGALAPSPARGLAQAHNQRVDAVYRERLRLHLLHDSSVSRGVAWSLALILQEKGVLWAGELAESSWPQSPTQQLGLFRELSSEVFEHPWALQRLEDMALRLDPWFVYDLLSSPQAYANKELTSKHPNLSSVATFFDRNSLAIRVETVPDGGLRALEVSFKRLTDSNLAAIYQRLQNTTDIHPDWQVVALCTAFVHNPTKDSLADALEAIASAAPPKSGIRLVRYLPWPIAACIGEDSSPQDLAQLASHARTGTLGSQSDWISAEGRWAARGILVSDLEYRPVDSLPFDSNIYKVGWPHSYMRLSGSWIKAAPSDISRGLRNALEKYSDSMAIYATNWALQLVADVSGGLRTEIISPSELKKLIEASRTPRSISTLSLAPISQHPDPEDWISFLEWLGESDFVSNWFPDDLHSGDKIDRAWVEKIIDGFIANPKRMGLLRIVSLFACRIRIPNRIPQQLIQPEQSTDLRFRLAALLVRLAQGQFDSEDFFANILDLAREEVTAHAIHAALRVVSAHPDQTGLYAPLLNMLYESNSGHNYHGKIERIMRDQIRHRTSKLDSDDAVSQGLPRVPA